MFSLTRGEELTALIAIALVGLMIAATSFLGGDKGRAIEIPLNNSGETSVQRGGARTDGEIVVHISGEVRKSGLLYLPAGSRAKEAVEKAGPTEDADLNAMNLAVALVDGERIVVPSKKAPKSRAALPGGASAIKVNVNEANQQQLESLPGIGPALAKRIIEFREKQKFEKADDLLEVRGIGPATLEKIRDYVSVK